MKLNWREKYAAYLLAFLGTIVLLMQIMSFLSSAPRTTSVEGDMLRVSKSELLSYLRTVITIILSYAGATLLFRKKHVGWIIGFAMLLLFTGILSALLFSLLRTENFSYSLLMLIAAICIVLMGVIFLLLKETRQKFMAGKKSFLLAIALSILLVAVYFGLQ